MRGKNCKGKTNDLRWTYDSFIQFHSTFKIMREMRRFLVRLQKREIELDRIRMINQLVNSRNMFNLKYFNIFKIIKDLIDLNNKAKFGVVRYTYQQVFAKFLPNLDLHLLVKIRRFKILPYKFDANGCSHYLQKEITGAFG